MWATAPPARRAGAPSRWRAGWAARASTISVGSVKARTGRGCRRRARRSTVERRAPARRGGADPAATTSPALPARRPRVSALTNRRIARQDAAHGACAAAELFAAQLFPGDPRGATTSSSPLAVARSRKPRSAFASSSSEATTCGAARRAGVGGQAALHVERGGQAPPPLVLGLSRAAGLESGRAGREADPAPLAERPPTGRPSARAFLLPRSAGDQSEGPEGSGAKRRGAAITGGLRAKIAARVAAATASRLSAEGPTPPPGEGKRMVRRAGIARLASGSLRARLSAASSRRPAGTLPRVEVCARAPDCGMSVPLCCSTTVRKQSIPRSSRRAPRAKSARAVARRVSRSFSRAAGICTPTPPAGPP